MWPSDAGVCRWMTDVDDGQQLMKLGNTVALLVGSSPILKAAKPISERGSRKKYSLFYTKCETIFFAKTMQENLSYRHPRILSDSDVVDGHDE